MFTEQEEASGACVSLGIPCRGGNGSTGSSTNTGPGSPGAGGAYVCKAGGAPVWLRPAAAPAPARTTCAGCGAPQALAVQLYAPVAGLDRVLYVWGCNNGGCAAPLDQRWRVLRQQQPRAAVGSPTSAALAPAAAPAPAAARNAEAAASAGVVSSSGCAAEAARIRAAGGGWGADDDGGGWGAAAAAAPPASAADIERLLAKREAATAGAIAPASASGAPPLQALAAASAPPPLPPPAPSSTPDAAPAAGNVHAETRLDIIPEPWAADDDLAHEHALLAAYQQREDGNGVARRVDRVSAAAGTPGSSGSGGERYEATPEGTVLFLRFTERLHRSPHQCVRYAYGGKPLWPAAPSRTFDAAPPPCPGCGAERVFELQLMPALLGVLGVANDDEASGEAGSEHSSLGWAALAIYSCDNSCTDSCEEYVRVMKAI